jgi:hypothetical protein
MDELILGGLLALVPLAAAHAGGPGEFTPFRHIPQFGIYVNAPPHYTPPPGVVMWDYGTVFLTQLTPEDQGKIGADVAADVTYIAQCDNYDRLGSLFAIIKPHGVPPAETDPRIELVRWITPFSDYTRGQYATHAYPPATLSPYAGMLTDKKHDVWIGIQGGSNPYSGDPCTNAGVSQKFAAIGFKYTISLASTQPYAPLAPEVSAPIPVADYTVVPVAGTAKSPVAGPGAVTIIISGHGSAQGGDEYRHTDDTVKVDDVVVGKFSTEIDCAPYAQYSPDGNPGIFRNNLTSNPRNWCPGALVPSHTFPVTIADRNKVAINMSFQGVPNGSYYATSAYLLPTN